MKKTVIKFFIVSLSLLMVSIVPMSLTNAAQVPLTDEKIETIRQNCLSAQVALQRIQRTDAAARVNRGQTYEVILSRLMSPFNGRLAFNRLDEASTFTATTKKFEQSLNKFKSDYTDYEDIVAKVLKIKCKDQPVTFYDTLTAAREARAVVASDILEMASILQEYRVSLDALQKSLPQNGSAVTGDN